MNKSASDSHVSASRAPTHHPKNAYISNPFTLLVQGNERLFRVNQTAAIVLVVLGVFLGILQIGIELIRYTLGSISGEPTFSPLSTVSASEPEEPIAILTIVAVVAVIMLMMFLVAIVISTIWNAIYKGIMAYIATCTIQNTKASIGECGSVLAKKFWQFLLASFLIQLKVIGGLILLIVPGIRASLRYDLVYIAIIDKDQRATEAMRSMKAITKGRLIEIFGIKTLAVFVPFIANVIDLGGQIAQYDQLTASYNNPAIPRPKVHWLNWLAFYLAGAFVLLVAFSAAVIGLILTLVK